MVGLTVTLLGINFASAAQAACGDHVVSREIRELMERYSATGDMPMAPPVAPCHGPGCKNAPADAPSVPAPVTVGGSGKTAAWIGALTMPAPTSSCSAGFPIVDHPRDGFSGVIFRPPEPAF